MPERHLVIDHLKFGYEGLFNPAEVYNIISSFFFEKGYDWYEKVNEEQITPQGKQIHLILNPWKSASDYYKLIVKIQLNMIDLKEVEVEQQGQPLRLSQGVIRMTIDAYVLSDRKDKWGASTLHWLVMVLTEKYFFRNHLAKFETWVKSDAEDLLHKLKSYLNTNKYTYTG
ncbi:MAG: hypothetical protein AABX04_05695 [Nanoarchaeota archaeon]